MEQTKVVSFIEKVRDVYFSMDYYDLKPTQQTHLLQIMNFHDKNEIKKMAEAIVKEG